MDRRNNYHTEAQPSHLTNPKPVVILSKRGFSEITFKLSDFLPAHNVIIKIVSILADYLKSLNKGDKYVIIARFIYADGSIRTLHKTQRVTLNSNFIQLYFSFLTNVLSLKSNDYNIDNNEVTHVTFNFFYLNPNLAFKVNGDRWQDLNATFASSPDVAQFSIDKNAISLPLNMDYSSWGTISTQSDLHMVVKLERMQNYLAFLEWNKETNIVSISGFPHTFTDSIQDNLLKRSFSDGTVFYIREGTIVLKTRKIETKFMQTLEIPKDQDGGHNTMFTMNPFNVATFDIETVYFLTYTLKLYHLYFIYL